MQILVWMDGCNGLMYLLNYIHSLLLLPITASRFSRKNKTKKTPFQRNPEDRDSMHTVYSQTRHRQLQSGMCMYYVQPTAFLSSRIVPTVPHIISQHHFSRRERTSTRPKPKPKSKKKSTSAYVYVYVCMPSPFVLL